MRRFTEDDVQWLFEVVLRYLNCGVYGLVSSRVPQVSIQGAGDGHSEMLIVELPGWVHAKSGVPLMCRFSLFIEERSTIQIENTLDHAGWRSAVPAGPVRPLEGPPVDLDTALQLAERAFA